MELFNSGHRDVAFRTPGNGEGLQLNVIGKNISSSLRETSGCRSGRY